MLLEKDARHVPVLIGLLFENEHSPHLRSPNDPSLISAPSLTEEGHIGCAPRPSLSVGFPVCRRERDRLGHWEESLWQAQQFRTQLKSPWEHLFLHTGSNHGVLQDV